MHSAPLRPRRALLTLARNSASYSPQPSAMAARVALVALACLGGAAAQAPPGSCSVFSTLAGPPRVTPTLGFGIAVNKAGIVFVADIASNEILQLVPPLYKPEPFVGSQDAPDASVNGVGTNALFYRPNSLIFGSDEVLYVTDQGNSMIRAISPDGVVSTLCGGVSGDPQADGLCLQTATFSKFLNNMAFDFVRSILYVADQDRIRAITTTGDAGLFIASTISRSATVNMFWGVALTPDGSVLYAGDFGTHYILRVLNPSLGVGGLLQDATIFAGTPNAIGYDNGIGTAARFFWPASMAVTPDGNLFLMQWGSAVIRSITPLGLVTDFAGSNLGTFAFREGKGKEAILGKELIALTLVPAGSSYELYSISPVDGAVLFKASLNAQVTRLSPPHPAYSDDVGLDVSFKAAGHSVLLRRAAACSIQCNAGRRHVHYRWVGPQRER